MIWIPIISPYFDAKYLKCFHEMMELFTLNNMNFSNDIKRFLAYFQLIKIKSSSNILYFGFFYAVFDSF